LVLVEGVVNSGSENKQYINILHLLCTGNRLLNSLR